MNAKLAKYKCLTGFFVAIYAVSVPTVVNADWSLTGLNSLGDQGTAANAINDSGQVTGSFNTSVPPIFSSGLNHAFITGPNGIGMRDLGTLGGEDSHGFGINNSGQVVGMSLTATNDDYKVFISGPNGVGMTDLGSVAGIISTGINDSGQIARNFADSAFITGPNGVGLTDLGNLGGNQTLAFGINNSGQVVGQSELTYYRIHAFITGPNGANMRDLGTLGGDFSRATGINDLGQVVGDSNIATFHRFQFAFITGPDGVGMTNLGTLGGLRSSAVTINNVGEVLGTAETASGENHFFLFSHGGMTDLNLLDTVVTSGLSSLLFTDINNNGQIAGFGFDPNGKSEAFILSYTPDTVFTPHPIFVPVPEPDTYLMVLTGLGLIGFMIRRRKQEKAAVNLH